MAYILINAGAKSIEDWIKFLEEQKQNLLTAGTNITIDENGVISASTGTTYEAGTGIDITGNTIAIDSSILNQLGLINMKVDIHYTDEEYVNQYIQNDSSHFRLIRTNSNTDKNSKIEITEAGIEASYDYSSTIKYVLSLKQNASLRSYLNNTLVSEVGASEDGSVYMECKDDSDDYIRTDTFQTTVSHKESNIIKAGTNWLRIDSTNGIQWSNDSGATWNNFITSVPTYYVHSVYCKFSAFSHADNEIVFNMITESTTAPTEAEIKDYLFNHQGASTMNQPVFGNVWSSTASDYRTIEQMYIFSNTIYFIFVKGTGAESDRSLLLSALTFSSIVDSYRPL